MRVKFLKFMAWTTAIVGIASACCLDSDSMVPIYRVRRVHCMVGVIRLCK